MLVMQTATVRFMSRRAKTSLRFSSSFWRRVPTRMQETPRATRLRRSQPLMSYMSCSGRRERDSANSFR